MNKKIIRTIRAYWSESLKRIPYVILIFLLIIIFQNRGNTNANERSLQDTQTLISAGSQRSKQIKELTAQNQRISKENQNYIKCIAQIFAQYTRNGKPITIENLDKCKFSVVQTSGITMPQIISMASPSPTSPVNSANSPKRSKTAKKSSKQPKPAPAPKQSIIPFKKRCTIEIFGVCI